MIAAIHILCVPVGQEWEPSARNEFDEYLSSAPQRLSVRWIEPVLDETRILDAARDACAGPPPDLLLLPVIHGGSARALVLAARQFGRPAVLWAHDRNHSLASSALAAESLARLGHPYMLVHGDAATGLREFVAAAEASKARQRLFTLRIGQLGPLHFNLLPVAVDPLTLQGRFGVWVVPMTLSSIRAAIQGVRPREIARRLDALRQFDSSQVPEGLLQKATAFHLALEKMVLKYRLDVVAVDCWNEVLGEFGTSPCFGFLEDTYRIACEGDLVLATTLAAGEAICGSPGYAGDLYALNEETGEALLMHCAGCAGIHSGLEPARVAVQAPPGPACDSGAVVACHPTLPNGPGTLVLLHGSNLEWLHLRRCEILATQFSAQMQVKIRIEGDCQSFRRGVAGNHYVLFPGDHRDGWATWATWCNVDVR